MACVNINLPEVKELSNKLQAPIGVIGAAINLWQSQNNNYEDFPTYEQLKEFLYKSDNIFKNNKGNIKEGVSELFESNPKLASIGTQEQYSQYLDTIFPDSKTPILYKGLRNKSGVVHTTPNNSFYTADKSIAKKWYKNEEGVKTYIVNGKTVETFKASTDTEVSLSRKQEEEFINNSNANVAIIDTIDIGGRQLQYAVNKSTESLELGSQEDIEGFKEFVNKSITQTDVNDKLKSFFTEFKTFKIF